MQYYAQDDKPLLIFFISKNGDTGNNQNYLKVVHWKKSLRNEQRCDNHFIDFYKEVEGSCGGRNQNIWGCSNDYLEIQDGDGTAFAHFPSYGSNATFE